MIFKTISATITRLLKCAFQLDGKALDDR